MITLHQLLRYIQELLHPENFKDYCINGLQVEGVKEIHSIATGVTANLATIQAAVEKKVQVLLVHHGLFWDRDSYAITGPKKEKIKLLLDHGISLLAYHLPLDAHMTIGNNWKAALDMGWQNLQPFGMYNGSPIGVKGTFPKISEEEFRLKLEKYYNHSASCALGGKKHIESAALVSGGAYRSIEEAIGNVDSFVTGNYDLPAWDLAMEGAVNFYALGHTATERVGPRALGDQISAQFNIPHTFLEEANPF